MLRSIAILCIICAPMRQAMASDTPELPTGCPPLIVLATALPKEGKPELHLFVPKAIQETRVRVAQRNGQRVEEQYKTFNTAFPEVTFTVGEGVHVYDRAGKEVDANFLPRLLKQGTVVLVSIDDKVDPLYLKAFRDDVLIVVVSQAAANELPSPSVLLPSVSEPKQ